MKGLPGKRKRIRTFFGHHAPPEDGQHLPQGLPREADSNISTPRLRSAHGQANSPASHKAETRATDKMH